MLRDSSTYPIIIAQPIRFSYAFHTLYKAKKLLPKPPGDVIFGAFIARRNEELVALTILNAIAVEEKCG